MSPRGRRVSASQVGQYAYCARAWWLSAVEKYEPVDYGALERGSRIHERHGWRVALARGAFRLAFLLMGAALVVLAVWAATSIL